MASSTTYMYILVLMIIISTCAHAYRLVDFKDEDDFNANVGRFDGLSRIHYEDESPPEKPFYFPCSSKSRHVLCPFLINGLARRDTGFLRFGRK